MKKIHLNCDLGEGGSNDESLMPLISACNIACGGHAGTLESMQQTVALAVRHEVEIGAHPSYPDKENFGRKTISLSKEKLRNSIEGQILSLKQIAEAQGSKMIHIKPHGALYNDAAVDPQIAKVVLESLEFLDEKVRLYAPLNSEIGKLAMGKFEVFCEAFADRNYTENYQLVSRKNEAALITEKEEVFQHLLSMFKEQKIQCKNGTFLTCKADTFCVHSDTPNAVEILEYLHQKFAENNIKVKQ